MSEETGIMIKDRIEYWQNKYFEEKEKNKELKKELAQERKNVVCKFLSNQYVHKDRIRDVIYDFENEIDFDGKLTELDSYCLLRAVINKLEDEVLGDE